MERLNDVGLSRRTSFTSDLRAVAALALAPAIGLGIARFAYALLLPAMRSGLGWSYADAGWMTSVNAIGYLVAAVLAARTIARLGAYRVMLTGVVASVVALILLGILRNTALLYGAWCLAGLGGAFAFVAGGVLATQAAERQPARAAFLLGLFYAGPGLGIVLSGVSVPWILGRWSESAWPAAWLTLASISVVLALGVIWGVRVPSPRRSKAHQPAPLRAMTWLLGGYGLFGAGYITYMTFMIAWIQTRHAGADFQALFWAVIGLAAMAFPWLWSGVLKNQRHGRAFAMLTGLTMVGALLPLVSSNWIALLVSAAVFGSAFFAVVAATTAFVRRNYDAAAWASGIGALTVAFSIGQTIGPTLSGWLNDVTGDLSAGLWTSVGLLFTAALVGGVQKDVDAFR